MKKYICKVCEGTGKREVSAGFAGTRIVKCIYCKGTGKKKSKKLNRIELTCSKCFHTFDGTPYDIHQECPRPQCDGKLHKLTD